MNKFIAALTLSVAVAAPAVADEMTYKIDSNHTFPMFEVSHLGFSIQRGRFNKTKGTIVLDAAAKQGSVDLSIDATSLDMGFATWDQHMAGEDYFNTEKFPTISFKSNKLVFEGDKVVAADGEFTLRGVTKPLRLTVSNFKCGTHPFFKRPTCGAEISANIKRSDYGMSKGIPAVGDDIKITSGIEAMQE